MDIALEDPFKLKTWIAENHSQLDEDGFIPVYGDPYQFQVIIQGIQQYCVVTINCQSSTFPFGASFNVSKREYKNASAFICVFL